VKKALKISGAIFTAVFYSIALFCVIQNTPLPDSSNAKNISAENQIHFKAVSFEFPGVPLTQESEINLFRGAQYTDSDFQYKALSAYLKYFERVISSEFVQYIFQAYNFPVKYRKSDLLFPFHYFW